MQADSKPEPVDHFMYPAADPKVADACAWVFSNPKTFEKYYFKFPEVDAKEVRARVLYASLCFSDVHHGRGQWGQCNYPTCTGRFNFNINMNKKKFKVMRSWLKS
jgi:hypothetical protein